MMETIDTKRNFLRHTVATLAYRGGKAIRSAPEDFEQLKISERTRAPVEILAHVGDLLDWALSMARGKEVWHDSPPQPWDREVARFFDALKRLDEYLESEHPLRVRAEGLFQGPIADALTHVGQLAMLRRVAGSPVRGENYFRAEIVAGHVGPEQPAPRREFD